MSRVSTFRVLIPLAVAAVVALTVLAYLPGMGAGFYLDDESNILESPALHWHSFSIDNVRAVLSDARLPTRPLSNLSLAVNHLFFRLRPDGYHWTNLFLHLVMGTAVACLVWLWLQTAFRSTDKTRCAIISLGAAAVFLLHPVNIQAVTYIVQRMALMSALFSVVALCAWILARRGRRTAYAIAAAAWLLALGSKENALVLPVIIVLYELCMQRDRWGSRLERPACRIVVSSIALALLAGAVAVAVALHQKGLLSWNETFPGRNFSGMERMLTQARVQLFYLALALWPAPGRLSLDHQVDVSRSVFDPAATLPALIITLAAVCAAAWLCVRYPRWGFPPMAYFLAHAIEAAPVNLELAFEHRMYLPMAFLLLLLASVLARLPTPRFRVGLGFLVFACVALAVATNLRNQLWADPVGFLRDTAAKAPDKFRPWYNLGTRLGQAGRLTEAESALRHALTLNEHSAAHNQLGNIQWLKGAYEDALGSYRTAVRLDPDNSEARFNLASVADRLGFIDEAVHHYREFLTRAPPPFQMHRLRAAQRLRELSAGFGREWGIGAHGR